MSFIGGKIPPAHLVPAKNPQFTDLPKSDLIWTPYAPDVDNVGGFPNDTLIYAKFAQTYYNTFIENPDPDLQYLQGFTITPPPGFDNSGADRDHIWVWVRGYPGNLSSPSDPIVQANPTWSYFDFGFFNKRAVPPPDAADNNFVIPDDYDSPYRYLVSYMVTGQNDGAFSQRYIDSLTRTTGFNKDWPLNGGTFGSDFNCLEHLFLHRNLITDATQGVPVQPFLGALTLNAIDQTGGWIQAINETDQTEQFMRDDPFGTGPPYNESTWQVNHWTAWYYRFLANTPDANSGLARTITYGELPVTNNTQYFGFYYRTELGFEL